VLLAAAERGKGNEAEVGKILKQMKGRYSGVILSYEREIVLDTKREKPVVGNPSGALSMTGNIIIIIIVHTRICQP
jgi:hypothetical protein